MAFGKFDGKNWISPTFKKFNGKTWDNTNAWRWDGSKWILITKVTTQTTTLNASWHGVYNGSNNKRSDDSLLKTTLRFGFENVKHGLNKSLIGFSGLDTYKGKKITRARLFIRSFYWENLHSGTLPLGWHNHTSAPSKFSYSTYNIQREKFTDRAQSKWIELSSDFIKAIENGTFKGFSIYINNEGAEYYANFYGVGSDYVPKLEITYES